MIVRKLYEKALIGKMPEWLPENSVYETVMGSQAYGTSMGDKSDFDIYCVYLPPKVKMFPHLEGKVLGFDVYKEMSTFQWSHLTVENENFDLSCYPITTYFKLAMECNPNIIESMFTTYDCVRKATQGIGVIMRDNRNLFLSKLAYSKFRGFALSQLGKVRTTKGDKVSLLSYYRNADKSKLTTKRKELAEFGVDWKFMYHACRMLLELEDILETGTMNLRKHSEYLKLIRRGTYTLEYILEWFADKEVYLEKLYNESKLQKTPDNVKIRELLINCLESHYGDLGNVVYKTSNSLENFTVELKELMEKYNL